MEEDTRGTPNHRVRGDAEDRASHPKRFKMRKTKKNHFQWCALYVGPLKGFAFMEAAPAMHNTSVPGYVACAPSPSR